MSNAVLDRGTVATGDVQGESERARSKKSTRSSRFWKLKAVISLTAFGERVDIFVSFQVVREFTDRGLSRVLVRGLSLVVCSRFSSFSCVVS